MRNTAPHLQPPTCGSERILPLTLRNTLHFRPQVRTPTCRRFSSDFVGLPSISPRTPILPTQPDNKSAAPPAASKFETNASNKRITSDFRFIPNVKTEANVQSTSRAASRSVSTDELLLRSLQAKLEAQKEPTRENVRNLKYPQRGLAVQQQNVLRFQESYRDQTKLQKHLKNDNESVTGKRSKSLSELSLHSGGDQRYPPICLPFASDNCTDLENYEGPCAQSAHVLDLEKGAVAHILPQYDATKQHDDDFANESESRDFLLFCFPSTLPPLDVHAMTQQQRLRQRRYNAQLSSTIDEKSRSTNESKLQASPHAVPSSLGHLPCGRLGQLLIRRSGRVQLRLLGHRTQDIDPFATGVQSNKDIQAPTIEASHGTYTDDFVGRTAAARKSPAAQRLPQRNTTEGGILFDVGAGSECSFAQEVGCIIPETNEFLLLGRCSKKLLVSASVEHAFNNLH